MTSRLKKPAVIASREAAHLLNRLSKATLLDMCWGFAQLGTDESDDQILTRLCREAEFITLARGDHLPRDMVALARRRIDSDPLSDFGEPSHD